MRLGNFEVELNLPGRKNIWATILISLALGLFASGMRTTHWLASFRKGYAVLVPHENQLSRLGPIYMTKHRTVADTVAGDKIDRQKQRS